MDFSLTEEQRAIRDMARKFALAEVDPIVDEIDEAQRFPMEVMRKAADLGFLGIIFPEEYGGVGLGYVEYVLVVTELSKVEPSVGISIAAHNSLGTNHIYKFGDAEQRRRWVTPLASGQKIAAWALTEAGSGSDAGGTAHLRPQGRRRLDPQRLENLQHARDGRRDLPSYWRSPIRRGARGATSPPSCSKRACRASAPARRRTSSVSAPPTPPRWCSKSASSPRTHLLGAPGEGFRQALAVLDGGRISIAALGLGTAIGAYETALAYSKQREQFGQPIAEFQAIRFALAEMATRIAAAEILTFAAAAEMDKTGKVTLKASEAKLMTGEAAVFCSERGVQIHGGYGFIKDYRAEKYYRDAKICTIGEGTSEVQRLVIARELLSA